MKVQGRTSERVSAFFQYTGNYLPAYQDREAYVILLPA